MNIYAYAVFSYVLTAVIAFSVIGLVVIVNKFMSKGKE